MNKLIAGAALIAGVMVSAQADAAQYVFAMSGKISYIANTEYTATGSQALDIATALKLGDAFSVTGIFDPADFPDFNSTDTDPTFGYYFGRFKSINYQVGGYSYSSASNPESFGSITINNDRSLDSVSPRYDGWSLTYLLSVTGQTMPVDLGSGRTLVSANFSGFDFSGIARSSDSVLEVPDLKLYGNQSGSFSFYNVPLSRFSTYLLSDLEASVTAVPEPSTWAMLLTGFALTGYALRCRKAQVKLA